MNRFKSSKYRNSAIKYPKKEHCVTDLSVETPLSYGNHIKSSLKYTACNIGTAGSGKLAVFGAGEKGRKGNSQYLPAHASSVTDFEFNNFHHNKLITASDDCTVKLWSLPENLSELSHLSPEEVWSLESRAELVVCNPIADSLFAVSSANHVKLFDINKPRFEQEITLDCDLIQSSAWSNDGRNLACTSKSKKLLIVDPRLSSGEVSWVGCHGNHKDSRVAWVSQDKLVTTGFSLSRERELKCWDSRNLNSCLYKKSFGSNTGVLMPFYDVDTKMVFVAGKGDSSIYILESVDTGSDVITEGNSALVGEQTKGMCISPKLNCDVIQCEVARLYQLSRSMIAPVMVQVPRRFYREFQEDLFPPTASSEIVLTTEEWLAGKNAARKLTSLDPEKRVPLEKLPELKETKTPKEENVKEYKSSSQNGNSAINDKKNVSKFEKPKLQQEPATVAVKPKPLKTFQVAKTSKFRHLLGKLTHPSTHYTNINKIATTILGCGNQFHCSCKFAAIPMQNNSMGHIAIVDLSKPGRQPSKIPCVENHSSVTDFRWSPFDGSVLAVSLDTGVTNVWRIPEQMKENLTKPDLSLEGHYSRVSGLSYHPLAANVLATCGFDGNVIVWDATTGEQKYNIEIGEELIGMSWSLDGKYICVISKQAKLYYFDPRNNSTAKQMGTLKGGCKSAHVLWVLDDKFVLVSYISKSGARCLCLAPTSGQIIDEMNVEIDNEVALLIPHYDEDTNIVFLAGKGDHSVLSFEVTSQAPYVTFMTSYRDERSYNALSPQRKLDCDVTKVEFARFWKLTKNSVEIISFTVPRVKMEYFQDDIFPDTRQTGKPSMSHEDWFNGDNTPQEKVPLKPHNMKNLSEAPKREVKERKYDSYNADTYKTDEQKREELVAAMSSKLEIDKKLEQDEFSGVDSDEWSD